METESSLETITSILYKGVVPRCDNCGQSFPSVGAMDTHMKLCKNEITTACDGSKSIKDMVVKTDMESATAQLYNNETPTCDDCSQPNRQVCFPNVSALSKHMEENHLVSLIKSYTDIHNSLQGEDVVKKESNSQKLYYGQIPTCESCDSTFSNVGSLDLHIKRNHSYEDISRSAIYDNNEKSWLTSDDVEGTVVEPKENVEVKKEANNSPVNHGLHACSQCGNFYATRTSLNNHMVRHTDKYKCHKCESSFESPSALKTHNCEVTLRRRQKPVSKSISPSFQSFK